MIDYGGHYLTGYRQRANRLHMLYHLKAGRERRIVAAGIGMLLAAVYLDHRDDTPVFSPYGAGYTGKEINPIDRLGYTVRNPRAGELADVGLYGGPALPFLFSLHRRTRPDYPVIMLLWLETMLLTFGLSSLLKNTVNRPRPYVYHEQWQLTQPLSRKDRAAFISGHTANATAGAVLFAELLRAYFPRRAEGGRWLAVLLAAGTGYLRVRAGKHWPTDAIAGIIVGGAIAGAISLLHGEPRG